MKSSGIWTFIKENTQGYINAVWMVYFENGCILTADVIQSLEGCYLFSFTQNVEAQGSHSCEKITARQHFEKSKIRGNLADFHIQ